MEKNGTSYSKFGCFFNALAEPSSYDNRDFFIMDLFGTLGAGKIKNKETIHNWIYSYHKNHGYKKKFKDVEVDGINDKFVGFLNKEIGDKFPKIQASFINYFKEHCEEDCGECCKDYCKKHYRDFAYIDLETTEQDVFFKSVLNQFKELVGLPLERGIKPFCYEDEEDNAQTHSPHLLDIYTSECNLYIEECAYDDKTNNPKKNVLNETPSEQMRKEFDDAIDKNSIAQYTYNLDKYLQYPLYVSKDNLFKEPLNPKDFIDFKDMIESKILNADKFAAYKDENIFQKITEFLDAFNTYIIFLGLIKYHISEQFGKQWHYSKNYDEIYNLINAEREKLPVELSSEQNDQLNFIETIFIKHQEICTLYQEICNGKPLPI